MRTYDSICIGIPEILLPKKGTDLTKWAVIACDQYTSEPDYWLRVAEAVGDAPSTLNLIYPEVYLNEKKPDLRIGRIRAAMTKYREENLFEEAEGLVYLERTTGVGTRKGLMACLDLEHYDYRKGATSLIRSTEGTILERIPPRVKIREGAPIEVPHIMVLIDDPGHTVISPLAASKDRLRPIYDFDLMMGSGHVRGYRVADSGLEAGILNGLRALADPAAFVAKYKVTPGTPVLLYAMGDGNHSLATAKTIWEKTKAAAGGLSSLAGSPLRYALVELVNLHDEALIFEPIHRMLFGIAPGREAGGELMKFFPPGRAGVRKSCCLEAMKKEVDAQSGPPHKIGLITPDGFGTAAISAAGSNLPAGTLQSFLDAFMSSGGAREIDYVHGLEPIIKLGREPGNAGFYLPRIRKEDLFKTVILDGVLPRKTFSMGEAWEKRFYLEARKLV